MLCLGHGNRAGVYRFTFTVLEFEDTLKKQVN